MKDLSKPQVTWLEVGEESDAQLAKIENMRLEARRSLHRALFMNSFQAEKQMEINNVMRRRFNTSAIRYGKAFKNAQRLAYIAKLAIEQRLGMRLADMKEPMPLVEAPSTWETSVCANQGIDWDRLIENINDPADRSTANFADAFIGDYVRNLENVVESYRMVHNFHEGLQTAVISLRDDVYQTRAACPVPSENLLYQASQLDAERTQAGSTLGWRTTGCANDAVSGNPLPDCLDVRQIEDSPTSAIALGTEPARGYRVTFGPGPETEQAGVCNGCGLTAQTRLEQTVDLGAGEYLLSWYSRKSDPDAPSGPSGAFSVKAFLADGTEAPIVGQPTAISGDWARHYKTIQVPTEQPVTLVVGPAVTIVNGTVAPHQFDIGALMLEQAKEQPGLFANTGEERVRRVETCNDSDGSVFRGEFTRGCLKLCQNGFDADCPEEDAVEHCYREANFNLSQRGIESGKLLANTGFALGNFNYRIENVAVNFVGTGIRDCSDSATPLSCNGRGFIPYTLTHAGPFRVRNHLGQDFHAQLFTGHIEHALGLGSERYITNPIGSSDRELLEPYTRAEFQGRPLDGAFSIRVWEDEGIAFDDIEDIQVVLKYRYWTRFD